MTPNLMLRFVLVYTIPRAALRAAVDGVCQAVAVGALTTLAAASLPAGGRRRPTTRWRRGAVGKVVIDIP